MDGKHEIHVVVSYIGYEPWKHPFRSVDTVHTVKVDAMTKAFELEGSAADHYALQLNDADLPEATEIGQLGQNPLSVYLVLKKEPQKGI
jgi:hypothetical protein